MKFSRRKKLVFLACIATVLLGAVLLAWSRNQTTAARRAKVSSDLTVIGSAVEAYYEKSGEFPDSIGAMLWASIPPETFAFVREPKDPWGRFYLYRIDNETVVIECLGADGEVGGQGENGDQSVRVRK